jgi:hypothetical protein
MDGGLDENKDPFIIGNYHTYLRQDRGDPGIIANAVS